MFQVSVSLRLLASRPLRPRPHFLKQTIKPPRQINTADPAHLDEAKPAPRSEGSGQVQHKAAVVQGRRHIHSIRIRGRLLNEAAGTEPNPGFITRGPGFISYQDQRYVSGGRRVPAVLGASLCHCGCVQRHSLVTVTIVTPLLQSGFSQRGTWEDHTCEHPHPNTFCVSHIYSLWFIRHTRFFPS